MSRQARPTDPMGNNRSSLAPGLEYQELHRGAGPTPRHGVAGWRTILGSGFMLFLFFVVPVAVAVPFVFGLMLRGASSEEITDFLSLDPVTPGSLAYLNIGLATAIGSAILVTWLLHGWQRPRWLLSVAGRIRWRWLAVCFGASVVTMVITIVVATLLPAGAAGPESDSGALNSWGPQMAGFLAVVLLLTPLQAAGEEFAFRGYLTQSWGGWAAGRSRNLGRVMAVVVPAIVFTLAHGLGQGVPVWVDRFAFGVVAGCLVIITGGLEAGIAMHVVNNLIAFGTAVLFGDVTETLTVSSASWWMLIATATQSIVYVALVVPLARWMKIKTRSVLEPSEPQL